jgi:hypothetical protein
MEWGLFGTWPMEWGGATPEARLIYESMRDGRGERFSKDDSADENCVLRAYSFAIADAKDYQQRGALQVFPQIATDMLPEWERLLGATNDPRANIWQRQGLLEAILSGNGEPSYDNIVSALAKVLDGEIVSLVAMTPPASLIHDSVDSIPVPTVTRNANRGMFRTGEHTVGFAFETSDGKIRVVGSTHHLTIFDGNSITVGQYPLSLVANAIRTHYFLSVKPGSSSLAWVASTPGTAIEITDYPGNPGTPGLYHISVVVRETTWADKAKRARMHQVLGPMLSAATTYDFITESPFLLDDSPLGKAGL